MPVTHLVAIVISKYTASGKFLAPVVTFSRNTSIAPTFIAAVNGSYVFELEVKENDPITDAHQVTIAVSSINQLGSALG
ncbi:hypothetical protein SAMN02745866_00011 [Alteromonadaceae bacterium Bs31]|nr:hypothetical protein SAMN02745866_00011 [Alteromonadaceae bacterium Bs31]